MNGYSRGHANSEVFPDFIIIGAPRAGTTGLYHVLSGTEGICMSRVKEPRFFTREITHDAFLTRGVTDIEEYRRLWSHAEPGDIRGEASPIYLHDPGTPVAIAEAIPQVRIIASLRDPVERAVSHWRYHEERTGRSMRSLTECIEESREAPVSDYHRSYLLEPGFYARHLRRWLEFIPRENLHLVIFDELVAAPQHVVGDLAEFLGVEAPAMVKLGFRESNAAATPRGAFSAAIMQSPSARSVVRTLGIEQLARKMGERLLTRRSASQPDPPDGIAELREIYRQDTQALGRLLESDLPWAPLREPEDWL